MTRITSYTLPTRIYLDTNIKNSNTQKENNNITLLKLLKSITNNTIQLKKTILKNSSNTYNVTRTRPAHNRVIAQAITSKSMKEFITRKFNELDLTGNAKKDPIFAKQACDAVLASVYSNKKDACCKEMISKGIDIKGYLKEAGEAARQAGLEGKTHNDVFTPDGAGANPFLTPVISSAQQKFPQVFLNKNQQAFYKEYAESKIASEVGKICKDRGITTPAEFSVALDNIAGRYLSGQATTQPSATSPVLR